MNRFSHESVEPFSIAPSATAADLLAKMADTSFQARNLGVAAAIWRRMLEDDCTVFLGLAGAMVPAGMRNVIVYLIENRLVDCLVSTGANLFHDAYETLGFKHWKTSPYIDDRELKHHKINRYYDVLAAEADYAKPDGFLADFANGLEQDHAYSTREFLYLLGKALAKEAKEPGVLTAAAASDCPVYCPAIGDSAIGMAIGLGRARGENKLLFDVIQDVVETTRIAYGPRKSAVIYIGGGTPKNYIQQAAICGYFFNEESRGHEYAIQMTMDSPQWGGLSGCTFDEAVSWGKIAEQAKAVTVNVDATIGLPLLASAVAEKAPKRKPQFRLGRELQAL